MKKLFVILSVLAVLGCTQVVEAPKEKRYYVYNSAWDLVDTGLMPRSYYPVSIQSYVTEYNEANNEDQLHLMDEEVPITQAEDCTVWIVDATTFDQKYDNNGDPHIYRVKRTDVYERREAYRLQAYAVGNGMLFVDKEPPAPIPPPVDTRTPYEKYALYMIDTYGAIIYEEHVNEIWTPETGYPTVDDMFAARLSAYQLEAIGQGSIGPGKPYRVIYGQIYTPPGA